MDMQAGKNVYRQIVDMPLRFRFFLSSAATLMLVTILVSSILYSLYEKSQIQESRRYSASIAASIVQNIASRTADAENTILEEIRNYTSFFKPSSDFPGETDQIHDYQKSRIAADIAAGLYYLPIPITSIIIMNRYGDDLEFDRRGRITEGNRDLRGYIATHEEALTALWGAALWVPYKDSILLMRSIYSPIDTRYQGLLACLIEQSYFEILLKELIPQGFTIILGEAGDVLYSQGPLSAELAAHESENYCSRINSSGNFLTAGDTTYFTTLFDKSDRWAVTIGFSEKILLSSLANTRAAVSAIAVIVLFVALLIAYIQAAGVTAGIASLMKSIREIDKGNLDIKAEVRGGGEVAELARDFNLLIDRLKEMIEQLILERGEKQEEELRRVEAEYHSLLAQLRPHFLYNALETINGTAKIEHAWNVSRLITLLGKLLRQSLSTGKDVVTIDEEIEHARDYVSFQNEISSGRYNLEIEVDEHCSRHLVPKFLIQPLVENSIIHGFTLGEKNVCHIAVEVRKSDDNGIDLLVADTGRGISRKKLEEIRKMLSSTSSEGMYERIGLHNINKRISILFGQEYGLSIQSDPGNGTVVRAHIPGMKTSGGRYDEAP